MASRAVAGTGAFIGSHVARERRARGDRVGAMDRAGADAPAEPAAP